MSMMMAETQKYLCIVKGFFYGLVQKGRKNALQIFPAHPSGASQIKMYYLHELNWGSHHYSIFKVLQGVQIGFSTLVNLPPCFHFLLHLQLRSQNIKV